MVKKLIEAGADINKIDRKFGTCLHAAYASKCSTSTGTEKSEKLYSCFLCDIHVSTLCCL